MLETPSNVTKFSFEGDYFVTAGADKTVNLWKTGFFDSYKEKLKENESLINRSKKRVQWEVK